MSNLNWVDFIILAIFFFSIISGISRGFVREIISLATLIAAFVIASMFASPLATYLTNMPVVQGMVNQATSATGVNTAQPISYIAIGLSFAILFAGTVLVGSIIGYFFNVAFQSGVLGVGNRLLGGVFGLVRGYIMTLVIIFVVQLTPLAGESYWVQSKFVQAYQPAVQWLGNIVSPTLTNLKAKIGQTLQGVGSQVQGFTSGY